MWNHEGEQSGEKPFHCEVCPITPSERSTLKSQIYDSFKIAKMFQKFFIDNSYGYGVISLTISGSSL